MRKISQLIRLGLLALILCNCNKESVAENNEGNNVETVSSEHKATPNITTQVIKSAVEVPSATKQGETESILVTFTIKVNEDTGEIVSKEVSENLLERLHLKTQEEFQDFIAQEVLKKEKARQTARDGEGEETHAECITNCYKNFTDENGDKKDGRGACKAGCWVESVIKIIRVVADKIKSPIPLNP